MERESARLGKLAIAIVLITAIWALALSRADTTPSPTPDQSTSYSLEGELHA